MNYLPLKSLIRPRRNNVSKNWKSCVGQKPTEGSNPSHCAIPARHYGEHSDVRLFLDIPDLSGVSCFLATMISALAVSDQFYQHHFLISHFVQFFMWDFMHHF